MATRILRHLVTGAQLRTLLLALVTALTLTAFAAPASAADGAGQPADPNTRAEIERLFALTQAALAAGNGAAVLPLLSQNSRNRIEAIRTAARAGGGAAPASLSPAEKVAVLSLQRFLPPAQLRRMATADLINDAIAKHWLSPGTIANSSLGPLRVDAGTRADAPLLLKGRPTLVSAAFVRDGDRWRIDLARTARIADELLRMFAALSGRSEDAYAAELVGRLHPPATKP